METEWLEFQDLENADLDCSETLHLFYIAKKYDVSWTEVFVQRGKDWMTGENIFFLCEHLEQLDDEELKEQVFRVIERSVQDLSCFPFGLLIYSKLLSLF